MLNIDANKSEIESLLGGIKRDGVSNLIKYLEDSDFYTAPASTRFHLSCEGGLAQHSLNVYNAMIAKLSNPVWSGILHKYGDDTIKIVSLLHDLCKINLYVKGYKNQKTYEKDKVMTAKKWEIKQDALGEFIWEQVETYSVEDKLPYGHGEKSALIASRLIPLSMDEIMAIRWHMGYSEPKENYLALNSAFEMCPLAIALHEADLEASNLYEGTTENKK